MRLRHHSVLSRFVLAVLASSWAIQAAAQTRGDGTPPITAMSASHPEGMTQDLDPADWQPILLASSVIDVPSPKPVESADVRGELSELRKSLQAATPYQ